MDIFGDQPGQYDCWCWSTGHATRNVEHGHSTWSCSDHLVRSDGWVWSLSPNAMRKISRQRKRKLFRAEPAHIPECCRRFRCCNCNQMLWSWRQLFDHHRRSHARCGSRVWRSRRSILSRGSSFLDNSLHVSGLSRIHDSSDNHTGLS